MTKVRRPFDLTTPAQVAAVASIDDGGEIDRRRAMNAEGLGAAREILLRARLRPGAARSATSSTSRRASDATELFDRLLHEGMIVRPLPGFGSPTAIRVSVGTPDELDEFAGALGRVLARA